MAENSITNGPLKTGLGNIPWNGESKGALVSKTQLTKGAAVEAPINFNSTRSPIIDPAKATNRFSIPRIKVAVIILTVN